MRAAIHTSAGQIFIIICFFFASKLDYYDMLSLIDDDGKVWFCIRFGTEFLYIECAGTILEFSKLKQTNYSKIYLSSEGEKGEAYRTRPYFTL